MSNDYEDYITRYCKTYGYTLEQARKHALCREVEKYYNGKNKSAVLMRSEFTCRNEN